jgi:lysophospholipase L1-like esterase
MKARLLSTVALLVALTIATGCAPRLPGGSDGGRRTHYYLALGDSLSIGVQPEGDTDRGYTNVLYAQLRHDDPKLALVELGCGGETAKSMIHGDLPGVGSCGSPAFDDWKYSQGTQLATAVRFLREHRRDVRVVTIDIGGNDILNAGCADDADPTCPSTAHETLRKDLDHIMSQLRAAAPRTRIVGMTYYNPNAAQWFLGQGRPSASACIGCELRSVERDVARHLPAIRSRCRRSRPRVLERGLHDVRRSLPLHGCPARRGTPVPVDVDVCTAAGGP